jgi:hypothetical protein
MKKSLFALAIALTPSLAWAQGAVLQNGSVIKFDLPGWVQDKTIMSGGKMFTDNFRGFNLGHFFNNHGPGVCSEDALTSGPYHQICIGHDANGLATISVTANNGAAAQGINVNINGTTYPFPGAGNGNAVAPTSPSGTVSNLVAFNGGTTLKDSKIGVLANGGLNATPTLTSGDSVTGVAGRYIFTDTNTTGTTNQGAGSFLYEHDFSGTTLIGDRAAFNSILNQTGAVAAAGFPGYNYSGANIYSLMNYNMGGSNSTIYTATVGQNFGANIIAQLGPGATHYNANVGLEVDAQGISGGSVYKQVGIYSVKIGPIIGAIDVALAVDAQTGANWREGIDLGLTSNPYISTSTLIGCTLCNTQITNGIYIPNVSFTGAALKLGAAIAIDGIGNISIGGGIFAVGATENFQLNKGGFGAMLAAAGPSASIANQLTVLSTIAGGRPGLYASGSDTNVDMDIKAKGSGFIFITGKLNLANVPNNGAPSVNSVCVDIGGNVVIKAGTC